MQGKDVTAIVLAGGQATRMGGADKALVPFEGRPLIAHVIDKVSRDVADVLISYNRDPSNLSMLGYRVYADEAVSGDSQVGPLAGIATCARHVRTSHTLVLPCDTPRLPEGLLARLAGSMGPDVDVTYAADPGRPHPLVMLARTNALESIWGYLKAGRRSVMGWCQERRYAVTEFDSAESFLNLNEID